MQTLNYSTILRQMWVRHENQELKSAALQPQYTVLCAGALLGIGAPDWLVLGEQDILKGVPRA